MAAPIISIRMKVDEDTVQVSVDSSRRNALRVAFDSGLITEGRMKAIEALFDSVVKKENAQFKLILFSLVPSGRELSVQLTGSKEVEHDQNGVAPCKAALLALDSFGKSLEIPYEYKPEWVSVNYWK